MDDEPMTLAAYAVLITMLAIGLCGTAVWMLGG